MRVALTETFWRRIRGSDLVAFGENYHVYVYKRGTEEEVTLWSAEEGGEEVAQPLTTGKSGLPLGPDGEFVWADRDRYDIVAAGRRVPWVDAEPGGGGEGGAVDSVNGQTGAVVLDAEDVGAQPADSDLAAIAALETTPFGRSLLALADAAAGRTALGLGTAATQASGAFDPAGAAAAAQAASQPLDGDLTAIAALSTTEYGRSVLAAANAAALRTLAGLGSAAVEAASAFQPADSDLTSIAALATQPFGRELLTAGNAAAVRTAISAASVAELEAHTGKSSGAHAATAISYAGNAGMSASTVEAAIDELASEVDIETFTFNHAAPTAAVIGGFFIRVPSGFTYKLLGARISTVSGSCKVKLKRTTSGGSTTEPLKEKEAKSEVTEHSASSETLADKDRLLLEVESASSPTFLIVSVMIEKVRT